MKGRIRYWISMGLLAFSLTVAGQSQEMVLINQGVRLHDAGKYNEAIACYDKVLKINPHSARAMSEMAMSLLHLQRYEEALRYSTRVINMHNEALLLSASIVKSSALSGLQRYDDAIRLLEDLLPKYGDDELLLYNLSVGYQQLEKWDKAIACIEKAIDANEYNSTYYQQYAELLEEEERYVEAYFSTMAALLYDATNDDAKQLCEALTELLRENISTSDNAGVLPAGMDKSISQRLQKIAPPTNGNTEQFRYLMEATRTLCEVAELSASDENDAVFWTYLLPVFTNIISEGHYDVFMRYITVGAYPESLAWLKKNAEQYRAFVAWLEEQCSSEAEQSEEDTE